MSKKIVDEEHSLTALKEMKGLIKMM